MNDYTIDDVIYIYFSTRAFATGIPTVLAGSPTLEIYENDSATPIVEGASKLVLGVSHNSIAGFNLATITLSTASGFENGKSYTLMVKTGTVATVSVVGEVLGAFTIGRSAAAVDLANGTDGLGALKTGIDAIPTTAMRGTDSAALATVCTETRLAELDAGNLPTDIAAIPTTAMRGTDSAALATVCTETRLAELDAGNLPTDIAAIPTTAMRGTDGANTVVPDAAGTAPTLAEMQTTALTESYAANGVAPTQNQLLYAVHQMLMEFAIAGTSYTVKKLDSAATAFVVTLDDATNPTSNTR